MLKADGQLVLIDFGTVREITETLVTKQALGQVTGVISAGYTPPEQLNGQAVLQSDFFALGRTFVYLLTSRDPSKFYDPQIDELRWRDAAPGVSPELADFLDYLMRRFPSQRPQTAEIILEQLAEINRGVHSSPVGSQTTLPAYASWVKPTQPLASSSSPTVPFNNVTQPLVPSTAKQTPSQIDQDFISRCQQELAELIGPIASIICQRTLAQNPGLSAPEFVETLAKKIPNPKQSLEFQQRLLS